MAKQLNVNLAFTADTGKAKAQLQDLQKTLDNILQSAGKDVGGLGITKDIAEATNEVAKLQALLDASKSSTGGLDLGLFNEGLKKSGKKISDYANTLSSIGPEGDQAFAKMAKSIISAEVPLKRTNKILDEFKTSLANTARWQLSSSMLHGFMGAVQKAYGYAQDLNKSLNDIRIVTGQNTDQMAQFAEEANKAAKTLSASTIEYTNAALIYYQQGLSDEEVKARTDLTIKMANASGQSAEVVSDQLTAIWNNYAEGADDLEHFADVLTKLGAETASSSEEISIGLEKFAAIGDTIGLSYDNAAAALATVTATTRQSAEVVGTAFKTIFARIQGLNLGETLDDGTSLNKYSEALSKVGISIFKQNGEIKKMDNILDEMGAKWKTISKDQQIALAQTVAGVRQYTQLVALMDNWDFYEQNLSSAQNADGSLQKQADIYAESWEAAEKRVKASMQTIYQQILNDEFFIDLNNGFAEFLDTISLTIKSLGGLPGVLGLSSNILFKMFGKEMAKSIDDWGYNIKLRSEQGLNSIMELREKSIKALSNMYANNVDTGPVNAVSQFTFENQANLANDLLMKEQELLAKGAELTEQKKQEAQYMIQINEALGKQVINTAKLLEKNQQNSAALERSLKIKINTHNKNAQSSEDYIDPSIVQSQLNEAKMKFQASGVLQNIYNKFQSKEKSLNTKILIEELTELKNQADKAGFSLEEIDYILETLGQDMPLGEALNYIDTVLTDLGGDAGVILDDLKTDLHEVGINGEYLDKVIEDLTQSWIQQGIITEEIAEQLKGISTQANNASKSIKELNQEPLTMGQKVQHLSTGFSSIATAITTTKGLFDTWNDDNTSTFDKLLSTTTSLSFVLPNLITGVKSLSSVLQISAGPIGWVVAGLSALTLVITYYDNKQKELIEASKEAAKQSQEYAQSLKEEREEKTQLIQTMREEFDLYQKEKTNKEALDQATTNLAEAYNIEFQALRHLQGGYQDYNVVLEQATEKQRKNLKELSDGYKEAQKYAGDAILSISNSKALLNNIALFNGGDFDSSGEEKKASKILKENVSSANVSGNDNTVTIGNGIDRNNVAEVVKVYDEVYKAYEQMNKQMTVEEKNQSGIYEETKAWIESMSESVNQYKEATEQLAQIDAQRELIKPDTKITNYTETTAWVEELKTQLLDAGMSAENLDIAIQSVVDESLNPQIKSLYDTYKAVEEVKDISEIADEKLAEIWGNENLDKSALAFINWGRVAEDSFDEVYKSAKRYSDALKGAEKASKDLVSYQDALKTVGSGLDEESVKNLSTLLDWGSEKEGIMKFSDFLVLTTEQQQAYLKEKIKSSYQASVSSLKGVIKESEKIIAEEQKNQENFKDETKSARTKIQDWEDAEKAYKEYKAAQQEGNQELANELANQTRELKDENGNILSWQDLITLEEEEFKQILANATSKAQNTLDEWNLTESNKAQAEANKAQAEADLGVSGVNYANALGNVDDLKKALSSGLITVEEFASGLINLASAFENCAEEIHHYQRALQLGVGVEAAQEALELSIYVGELAEKFDLSADGIENYAERLEANNKAQVEAGEATELTKKALIDMAVASQRLDKGVSDINDNLEDYKKVLKSSNKLTSEYSETMDQLKDNLADIFNVADGDLFSDTFAKAMLASDEFKKVLNGDVEALDRLRAQATVDVGNTIIEDLGRQANVIYGEFDSLGQIIDGTAYTAASAWNEVKRILEDGFTLDEINTESFVTSLNQMIQASGMTKDQITSMLGSMGVSAQVKTDYVEQETQVPTYDEVSVPNGFDTFTGKDANGEEQEYVRPRIKKITIPGEPITVKGFVPTYSVETTSGDTTTGGKIDYSQTFQKASPPQISKGSTTSGKKSGGGGGSSKPNKGVKKSDTVERYKEVNDALDDVADALNDANKETDRLFGADRLKNIDKENKLILENIKLLDQKKQEAEANLEIDRLALEQAAEAAGVKLDIDPNTNLITNYTEAMTTLFNQLDEAHKQAGDTIEEAEQDIIDGIQEKIDNLKDAISQYDETRELIEDLDNEKEEERRKIQDNNYEKLTYKLELEMIINDNEMKELDYYFGKMEDDIEKAVEAFGILQDKLDITSEKLFDYEDHFNSLEQAYAAGQISQADYIAGLQECYDALYDNLEALNDLDKQMMEYYGETYDLALEKIEEYTSQMEHLSSVLDHYKSIMSLLGKENNLKEMGKIIDAQVKVAEDSYKSSKSIYEMAKQQKEDAYTELMNAENDAERELLQKNYDKALEEFNNAQETMLSDAETYGELIKEALVNSMNQAAKEMEKALTGVWGSFEALQEQMNLHSTHQDEFLTNTNKLYETNKLLNQVAQDMEKTDNRASKAKYAAFAKEIEQLQEKDKLSNLELEIAQAKYNMLQAQIALEDAQNAKSMVRLTRDEEGNYGYVYTADKDKVNQAEQDLADAENDLYNIRLNATNDYAEKIVQARADMLDKLKELDERAAEDEEYRLNQYENDKANIQKAYYDLIDDYSRLHTIAQEEDVRVQQNAWTNFYSDVIDQGEDWKNAITDYNNKIILSFEKWEAKSDLLTEAIAEDITDITDASKNLKNTLVEDVIPAMADTLDEVRTLTAEYALQREGVLDLADAYKVLADRAEEVIRVEAKKAKNDNNNKLENVDTSKDSNAQLQETRPADAGPGDSSSSSSSGGDGILNVGDEVTFTGGVYYNDSQGGGPTGSRGPGKKVRVDRIKQGANYPIHVVSGDSAYGWLREDQLSGFNSGGYTGEWGTEGKLALLHEKELVLNPVDTENLLATISIIRELTKAIDLNATWASMGIGSLSAVGVNENSNILEQQVEIHAEFPNVTDHNEIEEAFNTLINRASQYAHRF